MYVIYIASPDMYLRNLLCKVILKLLQSGIKEVFDKVYECSRKVKFSRIDHMTNDTYTFMYLLTNFTKYNKYKRKSTIVSLKIIRLVVHDFTQHY